MSLPTRMHTHIHLHVQPKPYTFTKVLTKKGYDLGTDAALTHASMYVHTANVSRLTTQRAPIIPPATRY